MTLFFSGLAIGIVCGAAAYALLDSLSKFLARTERHQCRHGERAVRGTGETP